ncbi:sigma-70 family RNA polymerase sigma factor [Lichenicoccus sp.]|uniref:sigma-70 family RNA polymerase sigma factor n=1 Tax=Lichenicoccus sp. TaxID=2781899 RepID=UPI003D11CDA0
METRFGAAVTGQVPDEQMLSHRMTAAIGGDAAAYRTLLRDCVPLIAGIARSQGVGRDLMDDAIQETLLTLHRARATYDPARPFLPWLRAIARHRAVDVLRRQGRARSREVHDQAAYEVQQDPAPPASEMIARRQEGHVLRGMIDQLPAGQRQAVEHLGLAERSLEETARLTGRSKGALKVNFHRALAALRRRSGSGPDV